MNHHVSSKKGNTFNQGKNKFLQLITTSKVRKIATKIRAITKY